MCHLPLLLNVHESLLVTLRLGQFLEIVLVATEQLYISKLDVAIQISITYALCMGVLNIYIDIYLEQRTIYSSAEDK